MKVKEAVEALLKLDQEAELVRTSSDHTFRPVRHFDTSYLAIYDQRTKAYLEADHTFYHTDAIVVVV